MKQLNTVEDCEKSTIMTVELIRLANRLTEMKNKLNRMKFLKEFYYTETKKYNEKCLNLTTYISDLTNKRMKNVIR